MTNYDLHKSFVERYLARKAEEAKAEPKPVRKIVHSPSDIHFSFTEAKFLGDDWGKQIHDEIMDKYGDIDAIKKIVYDDRKKVVVGSNPFYVVAVNDIIRAKRKRTVNQAELEKIANENILPLKGNHWVDSSLVLRNNQNPNTYLANDIFHQFKLAGVNLKQNSAYIIPLYILTLSKDPNSPYKLAFDVGSFTRYFEVPILNDPKNGLFETKDVDPDIGLPSKLSKEGTRTLWRRTDGLSGLYLDRGLNINSDDGGLSGSNDNGRVVVVSAEGSAKKS